MPQGKAPTKKGGPVGIPKHERYAKRVAAEEAKKGGPIKAPKSAEAASQANQNFIDALPTMTRNAEMISAGKLIAQGSNLRMGELKKLAAEQLEMMAKKSAKPTVDVLSLAAARKHIKGTRMKGGGEGGLLGEDELAELADLAPELKKQLEDAKAARAKAAKKRHAHAGRVDPKKADGSGKDGDLAIPDDGDDAAGDEAADSFGLSGSGGAAAGKKRKRTGEESSAAALLRETLMRGDLEEDDDDDQPSNSDGDEAAAEQSKAAAPKPAKRRRTDSADAAGEEKIPEAAASGADGAPKQGKGRGAAAKKKDASEKDQARPQKVGLADTSAATGSHLAPLFANAPGGSSSSGASAAASFDPVAAAAAANAERRRQAAAKQQEAQSKKKAEKALLAKEAAHKAANVLKPSASLFAAAANDVDF